MLITKKMTAGLLVLLSLGTLSACGGGGNQSSGDDENVLTFYSWDNQTTFGPAIKAFEEKYPEVTVEFSHKPPIDEYIQGLQTKLLSNTAADVFVMGAENRSNLIDNKSVQSLSEFDFVDRLNETNQDIFSKDDQLYSASISSWGGGIGYNKKLLSQVGYDEFPKTWTEFVDLCVKLKDAGINPYYEGAQSGNFMSLYALVGGQYEVNGENKDADIFAGKTTFSKEYSKPLKLWNQMLEKDVLTQDVLGLTDDQIMNEFSSENVAMVGMGPWNVATVRGSNPDIDFMIAPVPGEKAGQEFCTGAPSPGYSINAKAKNPELAEKFVDFMTTPEAAEAYNGDGSSNNMYTTEGTESINETLDPALKDINTLVQEGKIYLPVMSWESNQDQLYTTLRSNLQELIQGKKTPEQVLKAMDEKLAEVQE